MFPPEQEWQRGQPVQLSQITAGVCAKVVEMLLKFMSDDPETQVVAVACQGLKGVVESVGPAAISTSTTEVMSVTNNLLMEKVKSRPLDPCLFFTATNFVIWRCIFLRLLIHSTHYTHMSPPSRPARPSPLPSAPRGLFFTCFFFFLS